VNIAEILEDCFDRIRGAVHHAVEGLDAELLAHRPDASANSIAWLVWHLTRVQDDHIADVAGAAQVWTAQGWVDRFGLPFDPSATGYGHSSDEVAQVRVASGDLLIGYHDAVHEQTVRFVRRVTEGDLDRIVDESWDPPVSLGTRLVSVVVDDLEHAGQAAYVRGLAERH
jgi:uncharacterized damage-inducible protein DinB